MTQRKTTGTAKKYDITQDDYAITFQSPIDHRTLAHILYECHFFREVDTPEETAQRNMGVRILRNLGAMHPENYLKITAALVHIGHESRQKQLMKGD